MFVICSPINGAVTCSIIINNNWWRIVFRCLSERCCRNFDWYQGHQRGGNILTKELIMLGGQTKSISTPKGGLNACTLLFEGWRAPLVAHVLMKLFLHTSRNSRFLLLIRLSSFLSYISSPNRLIHNIVSRSLVVDHRWLSNYWVGLWSGSSLMSTDTVLLLICVIPGTTRIVIDHIWR